MPVYVPNFLENKISFEDSSQHVFIEDPLKTYFFFFSDYIFYKNSFFSIGDILIDIGFWCLVAGLIFLIFRSCLGNY